jgi:hypothetical protein
VLRKCLALLSLPSPPLTHSPLHDTQTVEGNVSVIFSAEEMEETLAKSKDKLVVLFCGLTWCRWVCVGGGAAS